MTSRLQPNHKSGFPKGVSGNPKGRPKGTKDRRTIRRETLATLKGLTPLQFMLDVLQNPKDYPHADRMWAAEKAAPYVHRKMPIAVEGGDRPITVIDAARLGALSNSELKSILATLEKLGVTDMIAAVAIAHDADS